MDDLSARAIADYHALLRDEPGLVQELEERFFARMTEGQLTFGGRMLCSFPRPNLVSPATYGQIGEVCRAIFRAIEKVEKGLGEALWDRVDLLPEVVPEHRLEFGWALEPLASPGPQDIVADALREIRHPVGRSETHGFTESFAAVHGGT